jgi:hypothetical protein
MANFPQAPLGPRTNGVVVIVGNFAPPLTALYVAGTGNITVTLSQSGTVTLTGVPSGTWVNDISISSVTALTATGVIGFF